MNDQIQGFVAAETAPLLDMDPARGAGAANLIDNCVGDVEGMTVLLVCEDPRHGWYDSAAPDLVHRELLARGAAVRRRWPALVPVPSCSRWLPRNESV